VQNSTYNCLTNSSDGNCIMCPVGYYLSNFSGTYACNGVCPSGCLTCTNNNTSCNNNTCEPYIEVACTSCMIGFGLSNGMCLPCLTNCNYCSSQQLICFSCAGGFFVNASGQCQSCSSGCQTCSVFGCSNCVSGYNIVSNSDNTQLLCVLACAHPCFTCLNNLPNNCTQCISGYTLNAPNCTANS
jgi:hypothetical protein